MSTKKSKSDPTFLHKYDQGMLRSSFVSMFWAAISDKKKLGFTQADLAQNLPKGDKGKISKWFNGDPNWTVNTIASLAHALNLDIKIEARDRVTGHIYTPSGVQYAPKNTSAGITSGPPKSEVIVRRIAADTGREIPDLTSARESA